MFDLEKVYAYIYSNIVKLHVLYSLKWYVLSFLHQKASKHLFVIHSLINRNENMCS